MLTVADIYDHYSVVTLLPVRLSLQYLGRLGTLLARQNLAIQYMKKKGGVLKLVGINGQVVDGELGEEVECVGFSASKLHSFLSDCGKLAQKDCSGRSGRKRAVCLADAALQLLKKFK